MPIKEHFGSVVRSTRKKLNITQEELASLAGINQSHMGAIERGTKSAGLTTVARISEALGCSPAQLLDYPPSKNANGQVMQVNKESSNPVGQNFDDETDLKEINTQ